MPLDDSTKKEGEPLAPAQEEEEDPMATKQAQILEQVSILHPAMMLKVG